MVEIDLIVDEECPYFTNPPLFCTQDGGYIAVANPSFHNPSEDNNAIQDWLFRVDFHISKISQRRGLKRSKVMREYLLYKGWQEVEETNLELMSMKREIANLSHSPFLFLFQVIVTTFNLLAVFTATSTVYSLLSGLFFSYGVFWIFSYFKDLKTKKTIQSALSQEKEKVLEIEYQEAKDWLDKNT